MGHDHHHHAGQALKAALGANALLMVAEIVGGIVFASLALLADAAHMASDVTALAIALFAQRLMVRPASERHSYGLQRAEVIGALTNSLLLFALAAFIVRESLERVGDPADVHGAGVTVVALLGLAVNLGSAALLRRRAGKSLNLRGAYLHMLLDAVGSVGALTAGLAVVIWDATWLDPLISIAIALLVVVSAARLLREALHVLLEGTPSGLDPGSVAAALEEDAAVSQVHHLHMWSLASDVPALSAHVVLTEDMSLHDAQLHGDRLRSLLSDRFGIAHSTLELECHPCEGDPSPVEGASATSAE